MSQSKIIEEIIAREDAEWRTHIDAIFSVAPKTLQELCAQPLRENPGILFLTPEDCDCCLGSGYDITIHDARPCPVCEGTGSVPDQPADEPAGQDPKP